MKPLQHPKKIIFLALLLSLLFHTSSVIIVFFEKQRNTPSLSVNEQEVELPKNIQQQRDEWVETKARAGNFGMPKEGAPVMFVDDDLDIPEPIENEQKENIQQKLIPDETENTIAEISPEEIIKENILSPQFPLRSKSGSPSKETEDGVEQAPDFAKASSGRQDERSEDKTQHHSQPNKHNKGPQQKVPTTSKQNPPKPSYSAQATKDRPLTLAQLTQGFLNHMKDEGTHAIHMLGKRNGRPSDEQIKYERYLQKLSWCLQNSCNIHNHNFPPSARSEDTLHVLLALNKDGSLKHCQIAKPSGNRELDNFTLFLFKDASTSFPPVPQYLPHDPFTITYVIMVGGTEENRFKLYRQ